MRKSWIAENIDAEYRRNERMKAKIEKARERKTKEKEEKGVRDEKR